MAAQEAKLIIQQATNDIDQIKCPYSSYLAVSRCPCLNLLTGNQLKQLLRRWLSPADSDPPTNHNIARKAQHRGIAAWFFRGSISVEWKYTGSLLWIYERRAFFCQRFSGSRFLTESPNFEAGSRKSIFWSVVSCLFTVGTYSLPVHPLLRIL